MIVVLIGPHGAGKSSLGRALARELGWPFHDEIGRRLAADPALRPAGRGAEAPQDEFDLRVLTEEIARDVAFDASERGPRIIETWHPGNIAYAARRSPRVAAAGLAVTRAAFARHLVYALPVVASDEVLTQRHTQPGTPAFFRDVADGTWRLALALGARPLSLVSTDEASPVALARALVPTLAALAGTAPPSARPT